MSPELAHALALLCNTVSASLIFLGVLLFMRLLLGGTGE
jgi:hypothetical protein